MRSGFIILLMIVTMGAKAQVQEELTPTEKRYQSLVTEPLTTYKGFYRVGLSATFSSVDKYFNSKAKRQLLDDNAGGNAYAFTPYVQYGITDRLQVEVDLPYTHQLLTGSAFYQLPPDSTFRQKITNKTVGLSDMYAVVAYQLIHGSYTKPYLGIFITATIPTAQKNPTPTRLAPGGGEFTLEANLRYRKISFPYSYDLNLGYRNNFGGTKYMNVGDNAPATFKGNNKLEIGGSFNIYLNNWIIFKNQVTFLSLTGGKVNGVKGDSSYALDVYPGLIFQIKGYRIGTSIAFPVLGKSTIANPIYLMTLLYTF